MIISKNIFVFLLFLQYFRNCLLQNGPINKEARRNLWKMLRTLHNEVSRLNECVENGQPMQMESQEHGQKLIATFALMAENLKKPEVEVLSGEVDAIFAQIDEYLGTVHAEQRQNIMKLEAYNSETRLNEAMRRERSIECELNVQKMLENEEDNRPILQFISRNVLSNIQTKLEEIALFHVLTIDKVQQKYKDYFFMYFFKKEDLQLKKTVAEAKANQIPKFGEGIKEASDATVATCALCCLGDSLHDYPECQCPCQICGCVIFPLAFLFTFFCSFTVAINYEIAQCVRKKFMSKKIEKITKRIAKLEKEKGKQPKESERGQHLLLENGQLQRGQDGLLLGRQLRPQRGHGGRQLKDGHNTQHGHDRLQLEDGHNTQQGQDRLQLEDGHNTQQGQDRLQLEDGHNPQHGQDPLQPEDRLRHRSTRFRLLFKYGRGSSWKRPYGEGTSSEHSKEN